MSITLTVCEKSPGGPTPSEYDIEVEEERLTVQELIRNIVLQQVYNQNTEMRERKNSHETERLLNKKKSGTSKSGQPRYTIDWVPTYEHALKAFEDNQVLLLIDDKQMDDLDALVTLTPATKVTFLKLIPLVGG